MPARPRRLLAAAAATAVATAGLVVSGATGAGAGTAALHGHMTPASLAAYHRLVGHAAPDATFGCQTTTPAGCYGPAQIRAAYGIDQLPQNGAGTTIAIVDAYQSPTIQQDLASFDSVFGLAAPPSFSVIAPDGLTPFNQNDTVQTGWAGEISLDVEWAHAVAPAAAIELVLAKTSDDADIESALHYVVHHTDADVLSQSYGEAEQCENPAITAAVHKLYRTAKTKDMTVFASSGDQGAAQPNCDNTGYLTAVSTPASDPAVTAVGGTLLDADGTTGAYHGETAWNEPAYESATGGGYSTLYPVQRFQRKAVGRTAPGRGVPDVAYNAGINTGVLAVWSTSGQGANLVFRFGGTSAGSPQWAGLAALADQAAGHRVGLITPTLYALAGTSDYRDITTGDNTDYGSQGYPAGPGWDASTGLGSPQAQNLVPALAGTASASRGA